MSSRVYRARMDNDAPRTPERPPLAGRVRVVHELDGVSVELALDVPPGSSALVVLQLLSDTATDALNRLVTPDPGSS